MMGKLTQFLSAFIVLTLSLSLTSCDEETTPRPRGYMRIALPQKQYVRYDSLCPFSFDYPAYAKVTPSNTDNAEPCWLNVYFPTFRGTIHLSYKPINGNFEQLLDDARRLTNKHIPKADAIRKKAFANSEKRVYGLIYEVEGTQAASPIQFYISDSTHHFIRGALYFNANPNNDSLAPVIDFINEDIHKLIDGFRWK